MTEEKISVREEAVKRIKQIVQSANICMFSTSMLQWPMQNESLSSQWVDDEGSIWFLNQNEEHKKEFLSDFGNIQLFYSNASKSQFLNVLGVAEVSFSSDAMDHLLDSYSSLHSSLSNGPLTLIKVSPNEVYWWDNAANDMVPLRLFENENDLQHAQKLCA